MSEPTEDVETKVATNAAETFVESYYPALNNPVGRSKLKSFYIKSTPTVKPNISINGIVMATLEELQEMFKKQVEKSEYEAQSYDCNVINTNYNVGAEEGKLEPDKDGKKMSILVMVSGSVKYWKGGNDAAATTRGFTESFVLVPNLEAYKPKASQDAKKWLILSQTSRLIL